MAVGQVWVAGCVSMPARMWEMALWMLWRERRRKSQAAERVWGAQGGTGGEVAATRAARAEVVVAASWRRRGSVRVACWGGERAFFIKFLSLY